jgi:peptidoglycan/xylan/chitin deacetylase (PgdA/CDA1 family)
VDRVDARTVEARFQPRAAGLKPHAYRWRVVSRWSGTECQPPPPKRRSARARSTAVADPCLDQAPDSRQARFRLLPVQVVGCDDNGPSPVFHGPRSRKRVALTFDDGPSSYTSQILSELRHAHVHGTFFQLGDQVPGRQGVMRDILRAGDEIGNHSLHHELMPSLSSMTETNQRIREATGFTPCLFRPPYGGYDSGTVADASSLGMTTVIWDVDPTDWSTPGSSAIYQRVVGAVEPGSIVLMHDGGGNRSQTVAAVPDIIRTLRARGYRMVTVSRLLGQRLVWRPVG